MKKKNVDVPMVFKAKLPGSCKSVANGIADPVARRAYIDAMIDAETTFQSKKRKNERDKNED